jgi:small subunit ribosomal protein S17
MSDTTLNSPTPGSTAPVAAAAERAKRKQRIGDVIANKMAKTIIVRVERRYPHPKFKKVVTGYKKFYAHDEKNEAKVGDRVCIEETRPISKTKRWRLVEVIHRSVEIAPVAA